MERVCLYTLCFIALSLGQLYALDETDQKCYSRFDYDEQLLLKLLRIEDQVAKFREYIDELKSKEEVIEQRRKEEHRQYMSEQMTSFSNAIDTNITHALEKLETSLSILSTKSEVTPTAFTVQNPKDILGKYMTFYTVHTNQGNGYDSATGKFTCRVPGLYTFSIHMLKNLPDSVHRGECFICKNGKKTVSAYTGPGTRKPERDYGFYGATASINMMLSREDVVGACHCSAVGTMQSFTSFSGHLIMKR